MKDRLDWTVDGRDWPHRAASRFVEAGGIAWHVQIMGQGPVVLLLHGTGASTHSWAGLAPLLAQRFTVVAPDLPGHAFTGMPPSGQLTLPGMAGLVAELLGVLGIRPEIAAGHSAGAAIVLRMCLDGAMAPRQLISINGALLPLGGVPGSIFSPLARLVVRNSLVPRLFAWRAGSPDAVRRLLEGTGSRVDAEGLEFYGRLFQSLAHVNGALGMMAGWELVALQRDMTRLAVPLTLLAASGDTAIAPADAARVARLVPGATITRLEGLGHLAHEERPEVVARAF